MMRFIKLILKFIVELLLAGLAFWLLYKLAWLFGSEIVVGDVLVGNDSAFAISLMAWFERFWPQVPLWYPLQGAGVSLFHSYPMLTTFLGILVRKMSQLELVEVYRILSFATFPLTAWGVYVFARYKTGNQVAAFFAGVFFLLSQAAWVFQRLHGIFAQSFSLVFVPWSFLFFDLWIWLNWEGKSGLGKRLVLVLGAVVTALGFLTHVVTGMVLVFSLIGYAAIYSQLSLGWKISIRERLRSLGKAIFLTGAYLGLGLGLAAFWLVPFYSYQKLANREGLLTMNMGQLQEVSLRLQTLVGFGDFATGDLRYDYFFFALPVLVLAAVGLVGGLVTNASMLAWGLVAFAALLFTSLPLYLPKLVSLFQYLFTGIYFRALVAGIVLLPVMAGFGALFPIDFPWWVADKWLQKRWKQRRKGVVAVSKTVFDLVRWIAVSVGVAAVAVVAIIRLEHLPPGEAMSQRPAYGITQFAAYGPTLVEDLRLVDLDWKFFLERPRVEVSKAGLGASPGLIGFIEDFGLDQRSRVDVSAFSGENFLQYAPMLTDASFVNLYHYSASIIHRMWGYQQGVFYGQEGLYANPGLLRDLSKWFGVEYAVLVPGYDREENYLSVGWELVKPGGSAESRLPVYHFKEAEGLLTVSQRPVALVIGSIEDAAYDQVFRTANAGAYPYDDLWLVEGGERLDSYSLDELMSFDLLILHGYSYRSKGAAWRLIRDYVEGGGSVFIDTGWQFVSRDWGDRSGRVISLPEPAPVTETSWGSAGPNWDSLVIDPGLGRWETAELKPWSWEGNPWGAAVADEGKLREGAEVLISTDKGVVLARRAFGDGKIVWSGMNLISHAQGPEGEKEAGLVKAVFSWLFKGEWEDYQAAVWERDYPDELQIKFNQPAKDVWVLWREAFSPNWEARLVPGGKRIKLYRGGPGLVMVNLSEIDKGEVLRLRYRLRWFEGWGASLVSILTLVGALVYLILGHKLKLERLVHHPTAQIKHRARRLLEEEEDY